MKSMLLLLTELVFLPNWSEFEHWCHPVSQHPTKSVTGKQSEFGLPCNLVSQTTNHALYHMQISLVLIHNSTYQFSGQYFPYWWWLHCPMGSMYWMLDSPLWGVSGADHSFPCFPSQALFDRILKNIYLVVYLKKKKKSKARKATSFIPWNPTLSLGGQRASTRTIHLPYSRSPPQSRNTGQTQDRHKAGERKGGEQTEEEVQLTRQLKTL